MFGVFYTAFMAIGNGFHNINQKVIRLTSRDKALNNNELTYLDEKMHQRLTSDNRLVHTDQIKGDMVLVDDKTKNIIKNYTEDKYEKINKENKEKAIRTKKTVFEYCPKPSIREQYQKRCHSSYETFYKDVNSESIYVIRSIPNAKQSNLKSNVYVSIDTFNIIRKTDEQLECDNKWKQKLDDVETSAIKMVNFETKKKNITQEQYREKLRKKTISLEKNIKAHFIADDMFNDYISELNKQNFCNPEIRLNLL